MRFVADILDFFGLTTVLATLFHNWANFSPNFWSHWERFQNCGESVNTVEGGVFGTAGFDEIVATTYTGTDALPFLPFSLSVIVPAFAARTKPEPRFQL